MPKGYWVALIDVSDPEGYKGYVTENAKAFRKYGGPISDARWDSGGARRKGPIAGRGY